MKTIISDSGPPQPAAPTAHRVRSVLAIPAFRRLWLVTAVSATGDWLSLLALSALATQLATGYQAQSFALGGVVATKLLPALVLGPLAGALADRFDRRHVMVVCDLLRFGLFLSIPLVGSLWWLLVATLLIEICALFWIPAKDASVPNLLRRPDQVETANQLALVMTYGVAVITASGLFTAISGLGAFLPGETPQISTAYVALVLNGMAYLLTATTVWFRIREISGRAQERREVAPGLITLLRDGARFVASTPLIRGLVVGIVGAFTAGGIVVGSATLYAASLGGGNAAYGMLFISVFVGLALGMGAAPRLARRLPHSRLFGTAIVAAGFALVLVALAPHLTVAIGTVGLVGCFAGIAFLTGLTIIGAQVADEVRGRIVAFVQSIVRLTLLGSMALVPLLVGLVSARTVVIAGYPFLIDGTRVVMLVGGLVAAFVGMLAYRQMDDRRTEPLLPDLLAALRRGARRRGSGVLIAVEGATPRRPPNRPSGSCGRCESGGTGWSSPVPARWCGRAGRHPGAWPGPGRARWRRQRRARTWSSGSSGPRSRTAQSWWRTGSSPARWCSSGSRPTGCRPSWTPPSWRASPRSRPGGYGPDVSVLLDRGTRDGDGRRGLRGRRRHRPVPLPGEEHRAGPAAAHPDGCGRAASLRRGRGGGHTGRGRPRVLAALTPVLPTPPTAPDAPPVTEPLGLPRSIRPRVAPPRPSRIRTPGRATSERAPTERTGGGDMMVWDEVVGQPDAVAELSAAAEDPSAMTHAWLFTGPPGSGRSVAARAFAAALQCPFHGCGECAACRTVMDGTHADVREVIPEGLSSRCARCGGLVQLAARGPGHRPVPDPDHHRRGSADRGSRERAAQGGRGTVAADRVPALRAIRPPGRRVGDDPFPVPSGAAAQPGCRRHRDGARRAGRH